MSSYEQVKVIGFDADDTLWENMLFFQQTEQQFCSIWKDFAEPKETARRLSKTETDNIALYGFGVKSYMLSMIETSLQISRDAGCDMISTTIQTTISDKHSDCNSDKVFANFSVAHSEKDYLRNNNTCICLAKLEQVYELGKKLLNHPIQILDGVVPTLEVLVDHYRLFALTKGDVHEQETKFKRSSLAQYFETIEILQKKSVDEYAEFLKRRNILPSEFLMIGNSVRSDVLPVLELGGNAFYVPHEPAWFYETAKEPDTQNNYRKLDQMTDLLALLPCL